MAEFSWIPSETFGAVGFETEWLTVNKARQGGSGSDEALEKLCQIYWYPLYAYARGKGYDLHDAQDLTQEFFRRLLAKAWLENVDQSKGRFRAFLLASINNFMNDDWRRESAAKRGSGRAVVSLDALAAEQRFSLEPAHHESPDHLYDHSWAATVAKQAVKMLREEQVARDKGDLFEALKHTLAGEKSPEPHAAIAGRLKLSKAVVRKSAERLRKRYQELLKVEIARTVTSASELDAEIRHVRDILSH